MIDSNIYLKRDLQSAGIIILVGFCFGLVYPFFGDEWTDTIAFINGISIGVLGGIFLSVSEIFIFKIDSRKWSFIGLLITKTLLYFVVFALLILSVICLTRSYENNMGYLEYFYGAEFQHFIYQGDFVIILIYCLIVLIIINFTRQINRKVGPGVLLNFILGKYHFPKEEEHIFAFIDLKGSTEIAENIGALRYHQLLYEFFHDISKSILVTGGEIYRYVGDEIVISWKMNKGLHNANCLRTYFYIRQELRKHREKYFDMFGFVPDFYAAYHCGKVIRGEIGDVKSQLVFSGETMYITSKIEAECGRSGHDLLISSELMQRISLPVIYKMQHIGQLEGHPDISLYTLVEHT